MPNSNAVQIDNLNNGQWSELFAFDTTPPTSQISTVIIDADQNYFNIQHQLDLEANRKFIDRGRPSKITSHNTVTDFFTVSNIKTKTSKNGYLTGSIVDQVRQGVELSDFRHWQSGIFKISAGTPGHLIKDFTSIGISEIYSLTDNNFFQELSLFDSVEFITLQSEDKPIEHLVTFPIVTSDTNQRENFIFNGIIEPFPIRPVISYFSINFPFEPHGVSANFGNGNPFLRSSSDMVDSIDTFDPERINKKVFLDISDSMRLLNDEGTTSVDLGPSLPYISFDENYLEPFKDAVYSLGDELQSTRNYENDFLDVIKRMDPLGTTYLTANEYSGRTGFTYDNNFQRVDSIAFGGLLR